MSASVVLSQTVNDAFNNNQILLEFMEFPTDFENTQTTYAYEDHIFINYYEGYPSALIDSGTFYSLSTINNSYYTLEFVTNSSEEVRLDLTFKNYCSSTPCYVYIHMGRYFTGVSVPYAF